MSAISPSTKSKGHLVYRPSAAMTSPSDTILGPLVTTGGNQMPSALADQLFCRTSFLPEPAFDRYLDRVNQTKRPTPFATIRSFPSTVEWGKSACAPAGYQRAQSSVARVLQEDADARKAVDKLSHDLIAQYITEDKAQRAKLEAASQARNS